MTTVIPLPWDYYNNIELMAYTLTMLEDPGEAVYLLGKGLDHAWGHTVGQPLGVPLGALVVNFGQPWSHSGQPL